METCPGCETPVETGSRAPGACLTCPECGENILVSYPTTFDFLVDKLDELASLFGDYLFQAAVCETIIRRYEKRTHAEPEKWLAVPRMPHYEVSTWGRVRYVDCEPLRPSVQISYPRVCLTDGPTRETAFIHRIVWKAFSGPIERGMQLDHKNGIKSDPSWANLEPVTGKGNQSRRHATRRREMR